MLAGLGMWHHSPIMDLPPDLSAQCHTWSHVGGQHEMSPTSMGMGQIHPLCLALGQHGVEVFLMHEVG